MGSVSRIVRVNEILKREIADLLERESPAGGKALVSVTEVSITPDLRNANVFISILGGNAETEKTVMKYLAKHRGDIQKKMSRHVILKYTPVLKFKLDKRLAAGDRVLSILEELDDEDQ